VTSRSTGAQVIRSRRDAPDQPPRADGVGRSNEPAVNEAYLDVGDGQGLWLAHFRRDTVTVKAGERVEPRKLLGNVGNSGTRASSWPHLHLGLWKLPEGVTLPPFSNARQHQLRGRGSWAREISEWDVREEHVEGARR
jgi:hypothetical protein